MAIMLLSLSSVVGVLLVAKLAAVLTLIVWMLNRNDRSIERIREPAHPLCKQSSGAPAKAR
jgi:hypothetical protein